jgi:hypothetical protein
MFRLGALARAVVCAGLAILVLAPAAVRAVDGPGPLAAAMLALSEFRVAPERVDQLRGAGVDFHVPAAWLAGALAVLAASLASTLQQLAEPGAPHMCIAELAGAALVVAGAAALARRARG